MANYISHYTINRCSYVIRISYQIICSTFCVQKLFNIYLYFCKAKFMVHIMNFWVIFITPTRKKLHNVGTHCFHFGLTDWPVLYNKKHPVPYVFLAWPCLKHICPTRADCSSPKHWNEIMPIQYVTLIVSFPSNKSEIFHKNRHVTVRDQGINATHLIGKTNLLAQLFFSLYKDM